MADGPTIEDRFTSLEASNRDLARVVVGLTDSLVVLGAIQREQEAQNIAIRASERRDARTRRLGTILGLALAIILPLASVLVYWSLLTHVNGLLKQQAADRYAGCLTRNAGVQENVNRELLLSRSATTKEERKIHADSSVNLKRGLVDCGRYR